MKRRSLRPRRSPPRWPKSVTVEAPASSANLGPGFDALALALDLWLRVKVTPLNAGAESLTVDGEGADEIGLDAGNRFLIGLEYGLEEFALEPPVMQLEMVNHIPLARGLGSSAAASVAGLRAAEALVGEQIDEDRLLALASQIDGHPDNAAAALLGGFVVVGARPARFDPPAGIHVALFIPELPMRTESMRATLPEHVSHRDAAHNVSRAAMVAAALATGTRLELLDAMSDDRLHEPYRAEAFTQLPHLVAAARDAGALGASLSGAGSSVIALTDDRAVAQRAADAMVADGEDGSMRKVAGVLGDTVAEGDLITSAVVGIGINTDWRASEFPWALAPSMTSLRELAGRRPIDNAELLNAFLGRLEPRYEALRQGVFDAGGWSQLQRTTGRLVSVEVAGRHLDGIGGGVDPETGELILTAGNGKTYAVDSGEVVRCRVR